MTYRMLVLAGAMLLFSTSAQAQWLGTLSIDNGYDDNMFRNYSASASASTDISLMYGFFPKDENWAVNYTGSLTTFSEYSERMYSLLTLAAS